MRRQLGIRWYALRCALAHTIMPQELRTATWRLWLARWEIEARAWEEIREEIRAERALGIERREKAEHN